MPLVLRGRKYGLLLQGDVQEKCRTWRYPSKWNSLQNEWEVHSSPVFAKNTLAKERLWVFGKKAVRNFESAEKRKFLRRLNRNKNDIIKRQKESFKT